MALDAVALAWVGSLRSLLQIVFSPPAENRAPARSVHFRWVDPHKLLCPTSFRLRRHQKLNPPRTSVGSALGGWGDNICVYICIDMYLLI